MRHLINQETGRYTEDGVFYYGEISSVIKEAIRNVRDKKYPIREIELLWYHAVLDNICETLLEGIL